MNWSRKSYWTTNLVDPEYRRIRNFELNFIRILSESFSIAIKNFSEIKTLPSRSGVTTIRFTDK